MKPTVRWTNTGPRRAGGSTPSPERHRSKPLVGQMKSGAAAGSKAPIVPAPYKPAAATAAQAKVAAAPARSDARVPGRRDPIAPAVYRPQPAAKAMQPKAAPGAAARRAPAAPPPYRPRPVSAVQRRTIQRMDQIKG